MGRFESIQQLKEAERILANMFRSITLISELKISSSDYIFLRKQLKTRLKLSNIEEREIRNLWYEYPYTCLTVTVFTAIYFYDGNYWDHFQRLTNCNDVNNWKLCMWQSLKQMGLPLFDEEGTQKYVSTILGHAGVPKKSMEGFVKGLLIPALTSGLDAEEVLFDIRENEKHGQLYLLHKGVRDYLSSGGEVAVDFVDRCLHVLKDQEKPFKEAYKGILPLRVLNGLEEIVSNIESKLLQRRDRIRPPVLCLDPSEGGVFFQLPILTFSFKVEVVKWEISTGIQDKKVVACNIITRNNQLEAFPENDYIIANPEKEYTLSLFINDGIYKQWSFTTCSPLIFSANEGLYIKNHHNYAGVYWMVAKDDYSFIHSKDHGVTYERLSACWIKHRLIEITPSKSDTVKFISKTNEHVVPIQLKREKPYLLEESEKYWGGSLSSYSSPPTICIPKIQLHTRKMSDWTINIRSEKEKSYSFSISSLKNRLRDHGEFYRFSLKELSNILRPGKQDIQILGPLGMGTRLSFMLLPPKLSVIKQENSDVPKKEIATYQIKIDPSYELESNTNSCDFNQIKPGVYKLFVPSHVAEVNINALKEGHDNLSLFLIAKKVNWDIAINKEVKATNTTYSVYEDECLECTIFLSTNLNHRKWISSKIELLDEKGQETLHINRKVSSSPIPINLSSFHDTIKHSKGNRFSLRASFPQNSQEIPPIPLLTIEKVWETFDVNVSDNVNSLKIMWKEKPLLPGRVIRIWDADKPWKPFEEIPIPDGDLSLEMPWRNWTGSYLFEWDLKRNDDIFGFLDEVVYPQNSSNTYLYKIGNSSDERIHSFYNYVAASCRSFLKGDQFQYLNNNEDYIDVQDLSRKLSHGNLLEITNSLNITESEEGLMNGLINLYEWDWEEILSISFLKRRINLPVINFNAMDFGTVQGDLNPFFNKSYNELRDLSLIIPYEKGIINDFSVTHQIIQFVMRTIDNEFYKEKVENISSKYLINLRRVYYRFIEKGMVPKAIKDLINLRWSKTQKPPCINYPYLISLVAFLNRLYVREKTKFSFNDIDYIKKITRELCVIDDLWLFHDAYVFESILNEKEMKKGGELIGHTSYSWDTKN